MGTHGNNEEMVTAGFFLPDEVIFEILSWLPVKSLLRFKCVCKNWCSTIQDPMFIDRNMNRAPITRVYESTGDENAEEQGRKFTAIKHCNGLILEKSNSNDTHRLRNPATRQILNLPGPIERKGICRDFCYIRSTNELKVVYVDYSEQGNKWVIVYNILRVGTDFTWKRLDSSFLGDFGHVRAYVMSIVKVIGTVFYSTVFYSMRFMGHFYLDSLDLENDRITKIKIPLDFFSSWKNIWTVDWEGKLSLACVEQEQLNVRVLENYRNNKWADSKIVIPLTFLRDYPSPSISIKNIFPYAVFGNLVWWAGINGFQLFSFDTQSKEVNYLSPLSTQRKFLYAYYPSLLPLHFKVIRQIEEIQESLLFKFLGFCLCGS